MMIPLDSPPPFDDDSTPDDDPFNASNRPSSIGRVSDFPPIDEIDRAETKKRGLNDSSIQMFRLLVRGVRARSARISIMFLTPTRTSLSEVLLIRDKTTRIRILNSRSNTGTFGSRGFGFQDSVSSRHDQSVRFSRYDLGSSSLSSLERTRAIEQAFRCQCLCSALGSEIS